MSPPVHVPWQKDEGTLAHIISYLDEIATCQPLQRTWYQFMWPLPSSIPPMPSQDEPLGFIQGCIVELGLMMPPMQFYVNSLSDEFLGYARGLLHKGTVTYNPSTNDTKWIPVHGTASDLMHVEEASTTALCNMVLQSPCAPSVRLRRFREDREDTEDEGGNKERASP